MRTITFILFLMMPAGCSVFNPYNGDFTCPKTFNGKCVSPKQAYRESVESTPGKEEEAIRPLKNLEKDFNMRGSVSETTYQNALFEKLTSLLKEPTTPMIAPPQIVRVLILPYEGEGAKLFMPRYVYVIIDEPKWVLGNKDLLEDIKSGRTEHLPAK